MVEFNVTDMQTMVIGTTSNLASAVINFIPGLIAAILIFLLGWVIAALISRLFGRLLKTMKFEQFLKEQKVHEALGAVVLSTVLTKILYYYIIVLFLQQAMAFVYMGTITSYLSTLVNYMPLLIGAALFIIAAALFGEFIKVRVLSVGEKSAMVHYVARGAKALIVFLGVMTALETAGFKTDIIRETFVLFAGAIFFGLALAFGIAFGLGAQSDAKDWMGVMRKRLKV